MSLEENVLVIYSVIIVIGVFLGYGENRKITIFRNYDDVGLTFLIPASYILFTYGLNFLAASLDIQIGEVITSYVGISIASILGLVLFKNTFLDNQKNIFKTVISFATKLPLGILWVLSFVEILNPSGKNQLERSKNRGTAMVVITILSLIMPKLVVENSGNLFNPMDWIKGKRVGSKIRNSLK